MASAPRNFMHPRTSRHTKFLVTAMLSGLVASGSFVHAGNEQERNIVRHTGAHGGGSAGRALNLSGSGQRWAYLCKHSTVQLSGSESRLSLKGTCTSIELYGSQNIITLKGKSDKVVVSGSDNRLRIIGTTARVELSGFHNRVIWTKQTPRGIAITNTGSSNSFGYKP